MSDSMARLGVIYLPSGQGTPVGRFDFLVDPGHGQTIEVGTPVAADTGEGTLVGVVVDMRTVGTANNPVAADLASASDAAPLTRLDEVIVATVQVFHSPLMRPVRSGIVRVATREEMLEATGRSRMDWAIPAGVVPLTTGQFAPVCLDGHALLGSEAAHVLVGGLSGMAAKTSFLGVLLRSALAHREDGRQVAALVFNVKGDDLIYLDRKPAAGYELSDEDHAIYQALGVPAEPFEDVTVYAPALPAGGTGTRSRREDALPIAWNLEQTWRYLHYLINAHDYHDEKVRSFLEHFRAVYIDHDHGRGGANSTYIRTFDALESWFEDILKEDPEVTNPNPMPWGSHHRATLMRVRRMLTNLPHRGGGLFAKGMSSDAYDVPDKGWQPGQVIVVDIAGLHTDVQSVVIARTLDRLLRSAEEGTLGVDHLAVLTDELNAFAPSHGEEMRSVRRILQRVSTQGRYAGISLWGAAQKLSKIDELVRDNAATRALGITAEGELSSGVYGRMPDGLSERIATLPKGWMAVSHYAFRSTMLLRFPRPAWQTGKARTSAGQRPSSTSVLGLSQRSVERLTEGIPDAAVESILAGASSPEQATERLKASRVPDMAKTALHAPSGYRGDDDPFDLGD